MTNRIRLSNEIRKILARSKVKEFTLPQRKAIPLILEGKNVLIIAPTGTGKTLASMIPIFDLWMQEKPEPVSILYITPLRALNRDLLERLMWWANEIGMDISIRHGDTTSYARKMQAEVPPDMLITTPETLQAIIPARKMGEHLRNVRWVVVDEVHELVDSKRGTQLAIALERLRRKVGRDFQIVCLSATVGSPEKVAKFFSGGKEVEIVKAIVAKELRVSVVSPKPTKDDEKISEVLLVDRSVASRVRLLRDLILSHRSTLVFTNTRDFAEILSSRLRVLDSKLPIETHHSSLSKEVRVKAEREFKSETLKSLIATSSLELGIDIGSIDFVVQYQSPRETARIVQRVGRSGHGAHRASEGIIITTDEDDVFESAVIARRALNDELEPLSFHEKALDVLAHQIVGLTLDYGKIDVTKAFQIVKNAYPYRDLSLPEFLEVCKFLEKLRLIWLNDYIKKRRNGILYYFTNLSTIPDVKHYKIINMLTNQPIGSLDEEFVALHGTPGTTFIVKGEPWRVVSVDENKVFVEPSNDIEAAIPGWEGELIPVPFEVSQEVGRLRRRIKEMIKEGYPLERMVKEIQGKYPVDFNSAKRMVELIRKQLKFGFVPDEAMILIETYEDFVILHCCFGSKVNETLGRFLTSLLSVKFGSIGLRTDPYRIILRFPEKNVELIKKLLLETDPNLLEDYIDRNLIHSELFRWKFIQVAKRFGAIRKDAEYGKYMMERIITEFIGSPVFKETLREIKTDKLDVKKTKEVLEMIQEGRIRVKVAKGLSPMGKLGLRYQKTEVVGTLGPVKDVLEIFKKRLKEAEVRLICINCGKWSQLFKVKEIPTELRCPKCGAKLIAVTSKNDRKSLDIVKKKVEGKGLTVEEAQRLKTLEKTADLFIVYGRRAAEVLCVRGIGPETATRILARMYVNEDGFYRALLEAQRQWVRTRRFWS